MEGGRTANGTDFGSTNQNLEKSLQMIDHAIDQSKTGGCTGISQQRLEF